MFEKRPLPLPEYFFIFCPPSDYEMLSQPVASTSDILLVRENFQVTSHMTYIQNAEFELSRKYDTYKETTRHGKFTWGRDFV